METYKVVGDVKLNMYVYQPDEHRAEDKRAAIVFFFGGGWRAGSPAQFVPHCKHLASRGMVAMTADYRVSSRHGTQARHCVADAKSAVRWIRGQANRLGIDPDRIVAAGGSAGGHIAACTASIQGFEEAGEDTQVSSLPNLLVLFNPAVALAPVDGRHPLGDKRSQDLAQRMGCEPIQLSPLHQVRAGLPPTLILHGEADATVPFWTVEKFAEAMRRADNECRLVGYPGQGHGFFNFGRGGNQNFRSTLRAMDEFLTRHGYLPKE